MLATCSKNPYTDYFFQRKLFVVTHVKVIGATQKKNTIQAQKLATEWLTQSRPNVVAKTELFITMMKPNPLKIIPKVAV